MNQYTLHVLPKGAYKSKDNLVFDWTVSVQNEKRRFTISLKADSTSDDKPVLSPDVVTAISIDMFRPGWKNLATVQPEPTMVGPKIYRILSLQRNSRLSGKSVLWRAECVVESDPFEEFSWKSMVGLLDSFYSHFTS